MCWMCPVPALAQLGPLSPSRSHQKQVILQRRLSFGLCSPSLDLHIKKSCTIEAIVTEQNFPCVLASLESGPRGPVLLVPRTPCVVRPPRCATNKMGQNCRGITSQNRVEKTAVSLLVIFSLSLKSFALGRPAVLSRAARWRGRCGEEL